MLHDLVTQRLVERDNVGRFPELAGLYHPFQVSIRTGPHERGLRQESAPDAFGSLFDLSPRIPLRVESNESSELLNDSFNADSIVSLT